MTIDDASAPEGHTRPLLEVRGLEVTFQLGRNRPPLRAVDGVDVRIAPRETVGLVGESGSGKSTIGRAILGLVPAGAGTISFDGRDITHAGHRERRTLSSELQVIFQDPYSSLNPTRTIGQTLGETLRVHETPSKSEADARVREMLGRVGLPGDAADRYPTSFSGGQRQRIAIARALIVGPRLVICDEAVSALDLSVQAQVLNLLQELQEQFQLSYLFISHDLAVVRHVSHRVVVLYRGRVMEQGDAAVVCGRPAHPYTQALLGAAPVPSPDEQARRRAARQAQTRGETGGGVVAGCPFAPRCPHVMETCRSTRPPLETTPAGALVACHRWQELDAPGSSAQLPGSVVA